MRNDYLHQVDMAGFMLDDILLYLDTHEKYEQAVEAYTAQVGPLFMSDVPCGGTFSWVDDPWPWEGGCA